MNPYSIEEKNGRAACIPGAASAVFCFLHILLSQGGRTDVCQGTAQIVERNSLIKDSLKHHSAASYGQPPENVVNSHKENFSGG